MFACPYRCCFCLQTSAFYATRKWTCPSCPTHRPPQFGHSLAWCPVFGCQVLPLLLGEGRSSEDITNKHYGSGVGIDMARSDDTESGLLWYPISSVLDILHLVDVFSANWASSNEALPQASKLQTAGIEHPITSPNSCKSTIGLLSFCWCKFPFAG